MWLKLGTFIALFSVAASQEYPRREVGVHETPSFTTTHAPVNSHRMRQQADFSWSVVPREGFPVIAFNDTTEESEVLFKYDYKGTLTDSKNLSMSLFQNDCLTPADSSELGFAADYGTPGTLSVAIDIIQETIAKSAFYNETNSTTATIEFCVRVDYDFKSESLNFYETIVTISVDLTAGFTLDAITSERNGAEEASATIDCDVEIYYCYQNYTEVVPAPKYNQGTALEVCIRVVEEDTHCCLFDIDEIDVDQDQDGDGDYDAHTDPVTRKIPDPLSAKMCEDGICYVKTQLPSKFFTFRNPKNLTLTGVAAIRLCDSRTDSSTMSMSPSSGPSVSSQPSGVPS